MKILLLADVRGLGRKNEVVNAAEGHVRNFLVPKGLARIATTPMLRDYGIQKIRNEEKEKEIVAHLKQLAETISNRKIKFEMPADESGKLFGSINKDAIARALRDQKLITKEHVDIEMQNPIKMIGEHVVTIKLGKGIAVSVKVTVARSPS